MKPGQTELGAGDPCPMCGARSGVSPADDGFACLVCGAPRILVTAPVERPHAEKPLLARAKQNQLRRAGWGVAASLSLALGGAVLALGAVGALVFHFGPTGDAVLGTSVLTPLFFSGLGFWRARRAGRDARAAIEAAETVVAGELVAAHGGSLEATRLAELMRLSVERAEELVATAQVERMLETGDRLRVEEPEVPSDLEAHSPQRARKEERS